VFHWYFQTCLWEIWDQVYSARSDHPPVTYSGIRECIRDVDPLMDIGATIHATVRGHDRSTGDSIELTGRIVDATYSGSASSDGTPPLAQLAGKVTLYLETDDGQVVTVGGWGAVLEDVEATRVTVTDVEYPESTPDPELDGERETDTERPDPDDDLNPSTDADTDGKSDAEPETNTVTGTDSNREPNRDADPAPPSESPTDD
jgi:hypothetical protein